MPYIYRVRTHASMDRLEELIQERLQPGADKASIDRRIWDLFGETWAVMFTDLAGFSRQVVQFGVIHFLQIIFESQRLLVPCIEEHDGILLKTEGDSLLVIFRNPGRAVECAVAMQKKVEQHNLSRRDEEKILLCIGLGYGRVLRIGDEDVFGSEVNASSKLGEDIARAGEILVTEGLAEALPEDAKQRLTPLDVAVPGTRASFRLEWK